MGSEGKKITLVHPAYSFDDQPGVPRGVMRDRDSILGETRFVPMDVFETSVSIKVEIDLPGVNIADVSVRISEDWIIIEGVKRDAPGSGEKPNYLCMERCFGPFKRLLKIPAVVAQDNVGCVYTKGVLIVTMPKLTDRRKSIRQIPIKETEE